MWTFRGSRTVAMFAAALFLFGALGPGLGAPLQPGRASGRASDSEPNDRWEDAVNIADGEVIYGSILTDPAPDVTDWYRIDVPYGKVLNASMRMIDYNTSDPGQYNFQLYIVNLDSSWTMNEWEYCVGFQYWGGGGPATMFVQVIVNYTTGPFTPHSSPGRYALSASISDPRVYSGTPATGNLNLSSPPGKHVYRLDTPPGDNQLMKARLQCPSTGIFSLAVYNIWPTDGGWWLRNASWQYSAGCVQEAIFSGLGGGYYMVLGALAGYGTYSLSTEWAGNAMDDDNFPSKAVRVRDNYPHTGFVDEGVDWIDWWKVEVKAGRAIIQAYLTFINGLYQEGSSFNLSAWDKDLNYLSGDWMPQGGGGIFAMLTDVRVGYDGPIYFAVRAISYGGAAGANFIPGRGWYKLTFTLPNDPPQYLGGIPEMHLDEDTVNGDLVLAQYFNDTDGDLLTYQYVGSGYHTRPKVNATTGQVTFTPETNWNGQEVVKFRTTDDGPGNKFVEASTTVFVNAVNDPPTATGTIDDIFITEEQVTRSPDLTTKFTDLDDPSVNLTFGLRIVSQDTRPPNANLNRTYDASRHLYSLGPVNFTFGSFLLEVNCTDGHPGTVPRTLRFNLTVTHINHNPRLAEGVSDPTEIVVKEDMSDSSLVLPDLFTDPDLPRDYANDTLNYTVSGMRRLVASIGAGGRLLIETGKEEYYPPNSYEEKLVVTARDRFGRTQTLNLTVYVVPVNDAPMILNSQPEEKNATVNENQKATFRVAASDNDTAELTYSWYLDGVKDGRQTGAMFSFQPDYKMGGTVHTVKVVVSDGATNISREWNIEVVNVNRPPSGTITSPIGYGKHKKGDPVLFLAKFSDPDEETLNYTWTNETGAVIGTGESFSTSALPVGTHLILVSVTDGLDTATANVTVIIFTEETTAAPKGFIPGPTAAVALAATGFAMALAAFARRRKGE